MSDEHFDKDNFERKGYFDKGEAEGPYPGPWDKYRDYTPDGFKGVRWSAHHVIPQTSIKHSIANQSSEMQDYIQDVQYITKWEINNPGNLLGLPHYTSYYFYYQYQDEKMKEEDPKLDKRRTRFAKVKGYANTFNKISKYVRQAWLKKCATESPENHVIHLPTSWGHLTYNDKLEKKMAKIWDQISESREAHEADAETVAAQLTQLQDRTKNFLIQRGQGATRDKWDCRYDQTDTTWYKPFTMYSIPTNPLF